MKFLAYFVSVMLAVCMMGHICHAQSAQALCVRQHLDMLAKQTQPLGIASSDAETLIRRVASTIALGVSVRVVPCDFAKKAEAWASKDQKNDGAPVGEYIIFNPTWVQETIGSDKVQAIALFGHELGHFLNGHFAYRSSLSRLAMETEADEFAGCAVARLGGSWPALTGLLERLRSETDTDYPSRLKSTEAAKRGFDKCSEQRLVTPDLAGIRVLYFRKTEDRGLIEQSLKANNISYEVAPSEANGESNVLTCTPDFPFEKVRQLAILLIDAGMKLKNIGIADSELKVSKRISIEAYGIQRDLVAMTRADVMKLDKCQDFSDRPREPMAIKISNVCPGGKIRATIRYLDIDQQKWVLHQEQVSFGNTVTLTDDKYRQKLTAEKYAYYFAESNEYDWPSQTSTGTSNREDFSLSNGKVVKFQKFPISVGVKIRC